MADIAMREVTRPKKPVKVRVLLKWRNGRHGRYITDEEREDRAMVTARMVEFWRAEGVKHLGYWNSAVGEFPHVQMLEVPDIEMARQLAIDLHHFGPGKYMEAYELQIGYSGDWEDAWID